MLTKKRQVKNRKKLFTKIFLFAAFIVISLAVGFFVSFKLFTKSGYISPLSTLAATDNAYQDEKNEDRIKESLSSQKVEVVAITEGQDSYRILLKDDAEIIISSKKDLSMQLSSLQFILSRLTMEGKLFSQLDLRFDKPVIKFR